MGEKVFRFKSFGEYGYPTELDGSFLQNVKALVEYGQVETISCDGSASSWSFQLEISRQPPVYILLFVVEESMEESIKRQCKHCVYVGMDGDCRHYIYILGFNVSLSLSVCQVGQTILFATKSIISYCH